MKRRSTWVIPLVILVLLLGANFFRWTEVASRTDPNKIEKWTLDRWTGQVWLKTYNAPGVQIMEASPGTEIGDAISTRSAATGVWVVLLLLVGLWLSIALLSKREDPPQHTSEQKEDANASS